MLTPKQVVVTWSVVGLVCAGICLAGCGKKQVVKEVAPVAVKAVKTLVPTPAPTPIPPLPHPSELVEKPKYFRYGIREGDTLWDLAGNTPFMWPVIWWANRHWIEEPDWLDVGMEINIPFADTVTEVQAKRARALAGTWPKKPMPRTLGD